MTCISLLCPFAGTYKVVFTDGFEKVMGGSKISKARPGDVVVSALLPVTQR